MRSLSFNYSTKPVSLHEIGLGPFPLEDRVEQALEQNPGINWHPTGMGRDHYLDRMEVILTAAKDWQNAEGAMIDPVYGKEWGQTTSRFASSGAVLLYFGRLPELTPYVYRAMDWVCSRLPRGLMDAPDFQTREIMTAYLCLKDQAPAADLERWAAGIRAIEPEKIYHVVSPSGEKIETLHNWNLYLCAGEVMRQQEGLGPEDGFLWGEQLFHKYVPVQLRHHFTAYGMYRDPADPITYDIQSRLQLATALAYGYHGELSPTIAEILRRGALTTLLFLTPDGLVPFGGRSDQFLFREIAAAVLCELEARRYYPSHPALAGAFKRQAHRSTQAIDRWLVEMHPHRHLKQGFDPLENWGTDRYGYYSVYSLLASSLLGLAALFADDTIPEAPCPSEIGGFTFPLQPAFHKIFSNCQNTYLEIDTAADLRFNATGLGSFQRRGVPTETALAMPFSAAPGFNLKQAYIPAQPCAIGPAWMTGGQWRLLAELSENLECELKMLNGTHDEQHFQVLYNTPEEQITETYRLHAGEVQIQASVRQAGGSVERIRFLVPVLLTDGSSEACIQLEPGLLALEYLGARYRVRFDPQLKARLDDRKMGNRNGIYQTLILEALGAAISIVLQLQPADMQRKEEEEP